jgi:pimeloyl-ACP methyl ester carboxylesterase
MTESGAQGGKAEATSAAATPASWRDEPTSARRLGIGEDLLLPGAGVSLHAVAAGSGPLVVLLHGFPDFWYGWRHQLPALAAAGYRAVALDLRGYNLSDRPPRVEDYRLDLVADDVASVIAALGGRAHMVVGHDWGGAVAWHLATRHPGVFTRLAILNSPHPARFKRLMRERPTQALAASYMVAFQVPWLAERALGAFDHALLRRVWRAAHARRGAFTRDDEAAYIAAMSRPGALTAALSYYRAVARHGATVPAERRRLPHPVKLVWGMRDPALSPRNTEGLERWVPDVRVLRIPDAGHWVMVDAPEATNAELLSFLAEPDP